MDIQKSDEDKLAASEVAPKSFDEFIGDQKIRQNLEQAITKAKEDNRPLDHVLLYGPPGLGKSSLSFLIINAIEDADPIVTTGMKVGQKTFFDLLDGNAKIVFIDEVHIANRKYLESLYPVMDTGMENREDIFKPLSQRKKRPITFILATTEPGKIPQPMRDRCGIQIILDYYSQENLKLITLNAAKKLNTDIPSDGADEIARMARGTPRIAIRLLKRARDWGKALDAHGVRETLAQWGIDEYGLDELDRKYIMTLANLTSSSKGPIGVANLALSLGIDKLMIENSIEPYLSREGWIIRTQRGRILTNKGFNIIK